MRRLSSRIVSSSLLALALSVLVVGVVWASSGALQTSNNGTTVVSTTLPSQDEDDDDNNNGDLPGIDPGDDIDELRRLVVDLAAQVEKLSGVISTLQSDVEDVEDVARKAASSVEKVKSIADDAASDAADAQRVANDLSTRFSAVELRTSKLNEDGLYSGVINPNQLSRKLSPTDITGNWPLDRVTGELETKFLLLPFSGNCSTRYGYYSVLVSDSFRRVGCERIKVP
jgi:hypothetical protein